MSISLRVSEKEALLIKEYASMHNISISELLRDAVMEKIEDEYDLMLYDKAMEEFQKNPKTYTMEEMAKELGIK